MPTLAARRRPVLLLSVAACLVAGLMAPVVTSASAATAPSRIVIDSITGQAPPADLPPAAAPAVLAAAGDTLTIKGRLESGPVRNAKPAVFDTATPLSLTAAGGGHFTTPDQSIPATSSTFTLTTTADRVGEGITLTVTAAGLTSAPSRPFDVLIDIQRFAGTPGSRVEIGIGGEGSNCTAPTPDLPICGNVLLPNGAAGGVDNVLLSLGGCDDYAVSSRSCGRGYEVQLLADLQDGDTPLTSLTSPATLVMKCDKTECGTRSIQRQTLSYSLQGDGVLQKAAACPAKGKVGSDRLPCVDYVQSKRDGSGDTYLYLLFVIDVRGSWN